MYSFIFKNNVITFDLNTSDRQYGFTIIEILISITILAVLAALAQPSLSQLFSRNQARSVAKALEEDLRLGKTEARTRVIQTSNGSPVILCPYNALQDACVAKTPAAPDSWQSNGWLLFVDRIETTTDEEDYNFVTGDPVNSDTLIHSVTDYAGQNYTITFSTSPTNNRIIFGMDGALNSRAFSPITIATADGDTVHSILVDTSTGLGEDSPIP